MAKTCCGEIQIKPYVKCIFDFCLVILLHASYFVFKAIGSNKWGYYCGDLSIAYPYSPETISNLGVALFAYLTPMFFDLILIYDLIICAVISVGIAFFLTTLTKYLLGRLRPFFLDVCKPNTDVIGCSSYQWQYTCLGTDHKKIDDAYLSFFSGHSSFAFASAFYTAFYLQARVTFSLAPLLRPLLQFICISAAILISLTRFTDHYHHPTDIIAGGLIGICCSVYTFYWYLVLPPSNGIEEERKSTTSCS